MIKSLSVLKQISDEQEIDTATSQAIDDVASLLEGDLEEIEKVLFDQTEHAPAPVADIAEYILDAGGKRIRPALCMLSAKVFSVAAKPTQLSVICELLHNATLLHDDVIDEGDTRRGKPASRMVWSNALSILGGDYMLMRCVEMISDMPSIYMKEFVATLKALVEGEIVQLRLRDSVCTSREEYFHIVDGKTSSLFGFATFAGAAFGGASVSDISAMKTFGRHIGASFQLIDDVLDFTSDVSTLGKNLLADISQGKMTLPVILASQKVPEVIVALENIKNGKDVAVNASQISDWVKSSGALARTQKEAANYTERSIAALSNINASNPQVVSTLQRLALFLLDRGN